MMSVFQFDEYKAYVQQWIRTKPQGGRGEVMKIAAALGVHSTLVSQVLKGSKDFTLEQAHALSGHIGLTDLEREYLLALVQRDRAGTAELKRFFIAQLDKLKRQSLRISQRIVK